MCCEVGYTKRPNVINRSIYPRRKVLAAFPHTQLDQMYEKVDLNAFSFIDLKRLT